MNLEHPNLPETIDGIIRSMEVGVPYKFGDLWSSSYGATLQDMRNAVALNRCYDSMIKEGLIIPASFGDLGLQGVPLTSSQGFTNAWEEAAAAKKKGFTSHWFKVVKLNDFGVRVKDEFGGWVKYLESKKARNWWGGIKVVGILEVLIGIGLLWFAYRTDDRSDRLYKEESKYKERGQQVESLQKLNGSLQTQIRAMERADSIQKAKATEKP